MPRVSQIPTNHVTVYLIKDEYQNVADIVESTQEPQTVGDNSLFFFEDSHSNPPRWVTGFFGQSSVRNLPIFNSSSKGVLIVPISVSGKTVRFAVAFGMGRHLLKDGVIEQGFGLKVVLNSAELNSFRSIDKTRMGSVPKQSREQMSREVSPADFGIDIEQDLISSVTAVSNENRLGKIITGKDALSASAKVDCTNITEFVRLCYEKYNSTEYKKNFDWIDQIKEVRNSVLEHILLQKLADNLNSGSITKTWMAVPEIINWADVVGFRYRAPKRGHIHEDLDINDFMDLFSDPIILADLKHSLVFPISAEKDEPLDKWTALRCIYSELEHDGKTYVLNNAKWYEIEASFVSEVDSDFRSIPDSTVSLIPYTPGDSENEYNEKATAAISGSACMDQKNIVHGGGRSSIEFCDILTSDKKLIHVKKYGGSSVLSHLFNQGVVSAELFVGDEEFRRKLNSKLPTPHKLSNTRIRPTAPDYEVIYGIISSDPSALEIPFFSKVSFRNAKRRLTALGYSVSKRKINHV